MYMELENHHLQTKTSKWIQARSSMMLQVLSEKPVREQGMCVVLPCQPTDYGEVTEGKGTRGKGEIWPSPR